MRNFVTFIVILSLSLAAPACSESDNRAETNELPAEKPRPVKKKSPKLVGAESEILDSLLIADDSVSTDSISTDMDEMYTDSLDLEEPFPDEFSEDGPYESDGNEEWTEEETSTYGERSTDYFLDEDMVVEKERMIYTGVIRVFRPDYIDQYDSTLSEIEKRLTITSEKVPRTLIVEKWMSPINYRGYKFNRKKLMLYGVDKDRPVAVFFYLEQYYFALGKDVFELDETASHTPFESVSDTALVRHLRSYENSL